MSVDQRTRSAGHPTEPRCLNCSTVLIGCWCHVCGQRGRHNHRSLLHLGAELLETLTHADSRLWRTLRRLVLDSSRLTADYLAGRRASEIPPLRLFFVMLFLLFSIRSLTSGCISLPHMDAATQQKLEQQIQQVTIRGSPRATHWLRAHMEQSLDDPGEVLAVMQEWAERFTLLMLPIAGVTLWVLYLPGRNFSLYDHMIFVMYSLCFVCLVLIALFLTERVLGGFSAWLLLLLPLHLFAHMRTVYCSGWFGTFARMALLGVISMIALIWPVLGLAAVGLEFGARI